VASAHAPRESTAEPDAAALAALSERHALTGRQSAQLSGLLSILARERHAPTSVRSPQRALDVHVADSLVALELGLVRGARAIVDLGSGAGFPGLALAIALENACVQLLESQTRKCRYLEGVVAQLGTANARVACVRAEEWRAGLEVNDLALARALGEQAVVLEYAAPLLRRGGALIDWRGRRSGEQERRAQQAAAQLGMRCAKIRRVHPFAGARERHLHVYIKVADTPARFPRRPGLASRRPLGS
jgi:16S rRNA (guanine527-N7)-methyltransferase